MHKPWKKSIISCIPAKNALDEKKQKYNYLPWNSIINAGLKKIFYDIWIIYGLSISTVSVLKSFYKSFNLP